MVTNPYRPLVRARQLIDAAKRANLMVSPRAPGLSRAEVARPQREDQHLQT
jgi:hypothetical protein